MHATCFICGEQFTPNGPMQFAIANDFLDEFDIVCRRCDQIREDMAQDTAENLAEQAMVANDFTGIYDNPAF